MGKEILSWDPQFVRHQIHENLVVRLSILQDCRPTLPCLVKPDCTAGAETTGVEVVEAELDTDLAQELKALLCQQSDTFGAISPAPTVLLADEKDRLGSSIAAVDINQLSISCQPEGRRLICVEMNEVPARCCDVLVVPCIFLPCGDVAAVYQRNCWQSVAAGIQWWSIIMWEQRMQTRLHVVRLTRKAAFAAPTAAEKQAGVMSTELHPFCMTLGRRQRS